MPGKAPKTQTSIVETNRAACLQLIRSLLNQKAVYTLDTDEKSGHIIVKAKHFWTLEFEFPTVEDGFWYASIEFRPKDSLSSKAKKAWMVDAKSASGLRDKVRKHLDEVSLYTFNLTSKEGKRVVEEEPVERSPEAVSRGAEKVVGALRKKPHLMWEVLQMLTKEKLAGPWKSHAPDGIPLRIRFYHDPSSEDGLEVAASVSEDGSRWNTRWLEQEELSHPVKHPTLEAAMGFADKMLIQRGWKLL